ncbi:sensor histidine kinase [Virgibacillus phasianinus]|uniref:Heme sensor protein HssS n=1 Tax=Virgibacillus phasianinus TaxID=2017483 RepID=A0A220U0R2_9BACI|nr:HAMP domain-containing sensor histidine kinase [Virgibacillus phasianinus]ASK61565.1 sensor histidine kinase [Virgibacillus phasianinus]
MRTLYVRIIVVTMVIMVASAIIAFFASNIYYQQYLKPENDAKITQISRNIVDIYKSNNSQDISAYLNDMTDLGYKFYLVDGSGDGQVYGDPFRKKNLAADAIDKVMQGNVYHGVKNYPWKPFVTGFFDNELKNTIGIPLEVKGKTYALFVRPNTSQQFGEMRFFLAVLLILALIFSFLLVLISTSYIVKPIKRLTEATKKIAAGNYHMKLNVNRKDEIGRLARDFSKMSNILEQTEAKRQEFVSNVSHEIQSPLTSIQGFTELVRDEEMTADERHHYLTIIEKESKRLSMLGRQLLTLSMLDHDGSDHAAFPVSIDEQIKDVISTTEWQWRNKSLSIDLNLHAGSITGSTDLIQQIWMNLVTNAIRYTDNGGTISITTKEDRNGVYASIQDTGIGMSEQDVTQIFDRFYKVDKARKRSEVSTGLGLAIVKKIIEIHHGTIEVESEIDTGSTFHVYLPKK